MATGYPGRHRARGDHKQNGQRSPISAERGLSTGDDVMSRVAVCVVSSLICSAYLDAQTVILQPGMPAAQAPGLPPRDNPGQPRTGTSRIQGRVVSSPSGQPLLRAQVMLNGSGVTRRTMTDAQGRYQFADLPAGSFTITANKPGYVGIAYGQRRPQEPGTPVDVSEGQTIDRVDLVLPRGGVITVRVTDEFGEPVTGAQIQLLRFQYGPDGQRRLNSAPSGTQGATITDDRGEVRLYGLSSGEYVMSATARNQIVGGLVNSGEPSEGFAPTYYPGTPTADLAQTIRVGVGEEISAHFAMASSRLARITGTVIDSQGHPATGASVQISSRIAGGIWTFGGGTVGPDGAFAVAGVPPGDHPIVVRPIPRPGVQASDVGGEFASEPVTVTGADITGLGIVTGPGTTISGRVVWDGASGRATFPDNRW